MRHFVDRLGALRERNTVATIAKRVPWCELRETERKRDKWKNKERGAKERERERGKKREGNRENVSDRGRREEEGAKCPRGTERTAEIRGAGGRGGRRRGIGIFSS